MLDLLNRACELIGSFATYNELLDHIHKAELSRVNLLNQMNYTLEHPHDFSKQGMWRFIIYRNAELKIIYSTMNKPPLVGIEKEAFERGLDLIEIHRGDADSPVQIPMTEDVNIQDLQQDWCESYYKAHGYSIREVPDSFEQEAETPVTGGSDDPAV